MVSSESLTSLKGQVSLKADEDSNLVDAGPAECKNNFLCESPVLRFHIIIEMDYRLMT